MNTKCITKTCIATILLTAVAHNVRAATYPYEGSGLSVLTYGQYMGPNAGYDYSSSAEMVSGDGYVFTATSNQHNDVQISVGLPGNSADYWVVTLPSPAGQQLTPGYYNDNIPTWSLKHMINGKRFSDIGEYGRYADGEAFLPFADNSPRNEFYINSILFDQAGSLSSLDASVFIDYAWPFGSGVWHNHYGAASIVINGTITTPLPSTIFLLPAGLLLLGRYSRNTKKMTQSRGQSRGQRS